MRQVHRCALTGLSLTLSSWFLVVSCLLVDVAEHRCPAADCWRDSGLRTKRKNTSLAVIQFAGRLTSADIRTDWEDPCEPLAEVGQRRAALTTAVTEAMYSWRSRRLLVEILSNRCGWRKLATGAWALRADTQPIPLLRCLVLCAGTQHGPSFHIGAGGHMLRAIRSATKAPRLSFRHVTATGQSQSPAKLRDAHRRSEPSALPQLVVHYR